MNSSDTLSVYTNRACSSVDEPCLKSSAPHTEVQKLEMELFIRNAFELFRYGDIILNDRQMYLCPVCEDCGLSFHVSHDYFSNLTLGILIVWWRNCPEAHITDGNGQWLVYKFVGSAGSGWNNCWLLNGQGETREEKVPNFFKIWSTLRDTKSRYDKDRTELPPYHLEDVLGRLDTVIDSFAISEADRKTMDVIPIMRSLYSDINALTEKYAGLQDKYHDALMQLRRERLTEFVISYDKKVSKDKADIDELKKKRTELRTRLRDGQMDLRQYERMWTPFARIIRKLKRSWREDKTKALGEIIPEDSIDLPEVRKFLLRPQPPQEKVNLMGAFNSTRWIIADIRRQLNNE